MCQSCLPGSPTECLLFSDASIPFSFLGVKALFLPLLTHLAVPISPEISQGGRWAFRVETGDRRPQSLCRAVLGLKGNGAVQGEGKARIPFGVATIQVNFAA